MGVPTSEVGYTSATTGRGDHKVHKGHVVALDNNNNNNSRQLSNCHMFQGVFLRMAIWCRNKEEFDGCHALYFMICILLSALVG
jgi:hypothetical protein